jgi:hypothetical protein
LDVAAATFALGGHTLISTTYQGGGGNIQLTQSTTAAFSAEVDYSYSGPGPAPTPEPATMGLMGSALIGLGVLGKKYVRRG